MTLKIGGGNYDNFYDNGSLEKLSNNSLNKTGAANVGTLSNVATTQTVKPGNLPPIPNEGYFAVGKADDTEYDAAYRGLMNAARRAGIADPKAQAQFAESVIGKPTAENRKDFTLKNANNQKEITDAQFNDLQGLTSNLKLSKEDVESLREFRRNYVEVEHGRILSPREIAQKITSAEKQLVARPPYLTDDNAAVDNTGAVDGIADPNAPKTRTFTIMLPERKKSENETLTDRALLGYVQETYGGDKSNLQGPNITDIRDGAKSAGVKLISITEPTPKGAAKQWVTIKVSAGDVQKIKNLYIKEQTQVNFEIAAQQKAEDKSVIESFTRGFFKGAWNDLKGNAEMVYEVGKAVADPIGTANKIGQAIAELPKFGADVVNGLGTAASEFVKMTPDQMKAFAAELTNQGVTGLANLDGSALFEKLGEIAGTVAAEVVLMKGASVAFKAFEGTKVGAAMIAKAGEYGQSVAGKVAHFVSDEEALAAANRIRQALQSPTAYAGVAGAEMMADLAKVAANKIATGATKFADFSKQMIQEFGDAVKPHLSKLYQDGFISLDLAKGKQILNSSGKAIDQAVVREAKETVADLVRQNKPVELQAYLKEIDNKHGENMVLELKQTQSQFIGNLSETTRRTVDTHDLLGGHTRAKHIGRSETWLRNRLENDPTLRTEKYASSFKNETTANRAIGQLIKQHKTEIEAFLNNPEAIRLQVVFDMGENTGIGVTRGKTGHWESSRVYSMIAKDGSVNGWHIETAYPTLAKEIIK